MSSEVIGKEGECRRKGTDIHWDHSGSVPAMGQAWSSLTCTEAVRMK